MPTPWSATLISIQSSTRPRPHLHRRSRLAVLDGVLDQVADRRHELAPVADDDQRVRLRASVSTGASVEIVISSLSGQFRDAIDAAADHVGDSHRLVRALGSRSRCGTAPSDRRSCGWHGRVSASIRVTTRCDRVEVGLVDERLGQHRQRADRRLQFVRDVGDEVGARLLDPAPLRDVVDERHAAPVRQRPGGDRRTPSWADRTTRSCGSLTVPARPSARWRSIASSIEHAGVRSCQAARGLVAVLDVAVRVADHDPGRMAFEHVAERDVTRRARRAIAASIRVSRVSSGRSPTRRANADSDRDERSGSAVIRLRWRDPWRWRSGRASRVPPRARGAHPWR